MVSTVTPTRNRGVSTQRHASTAAATSGTAIAKRSATGNAFGSARLVSPLGNWSRISRTGEARLRASPERIAVDADVAKPPQGGYGDQRTAEGHNPGAATTRGRGAQPGREDDCRQQEHARVASEKQRPGEEQHTREPW